MIKRFYRMTFENSFIFVRRCTYSAVRANVGRVFRTSSIPCRVITLRGSEAILDSSPALRVMCELSCCRGCVQSAAGECQWQVPVASASVKCRPRPPHPAGSRKRAAAPKMFYLNDFERKTLILEPRLEDSSRQRRSKMTPIFRSIFSTLNSIFTYD